MPSDCVVIVVVLGSGTAMACSSVRGHDVLAEDIFSGLMCICFVKIRDVD